LAFCNASLIYPLRDLPFAATLPRSSCNGTQPSGPPIGTRPNPTVPCAGVTSIARPARPAPTPHPEGLTPNVAPSSRTAALAPRAPTELYPHATPIAPAPEPHPPATRPWSHEAKPWSRSPGYCSRCVGP
jgi:hypothetical protein